VDLETLEQLSLCHDGGSWTVTVKTSEGERTATSGNVQITMYGTSGHTAALLLSSSDPGTLAFASGPSLSSISAPGRFAEKPRSD
ncbi:hypothetical protein MAR_021669, partial [Mya arenaria]